MPIRAIESAATGMEAQQVKLDQISNDLANMNTTAFKRGITEFQDLLYQTLKDPGSASSQTTINPVGIQVGTGTKVVSMSKDFRQGGVQITHNNFDFMINGDGFFMIQKPNGEMAYSRNGAMKVDNQGRLVNSSGYVIMPPIQIPPETQNIAVSADGLVSVRTPQNESQPVGQIMINGFSNANGLSSQGDGLYVPTIASGAPRQGVPGEGGLGNLMQGALEQSNVNVVESMVDMIKTQRAYELNSKVLSTADKMMEYAINPR